jgi:outer membrane protein OmpA-like peptidoglycan-associated protein
MLKKKQINWTWMKSFIHLFKIKLIQEENHMFTGKKILILITFFIFSCASVNKAKLASDNVKDAIVEVQTLKENSRINQFDLLANKEFKNGKHSLNEALEGLNNEDKDSETLETLSESKAYFLAAKKRADSRAVIPERILTARKATLDNGVRDTQNLTLKLEEIDSSLRDKTKSFSKMLSVEKLSQFERDYLNLEVNSVQNKELKDFREIVKSAEQNKASKVATKTYRSAKNDLMAAENMIQQSPRNPENYIDSVSLADKSTWLLNDVMKKLKGVASGASEQAALSLVYQERKLGLLSNRANNLQVYLNKSQSDLGNAKDELKSERSESLSAENKVRVQAAMDNVRRNFTNKEAEVYQQGNQIIIRLKEMDFKSGSAMVPSKSMGLLSKVNEAIIGLHSSNVVIQGHTDSTGKSGNNHILSVKRSQAVARYLKSLDSSYNMSARGYGESQPIANNETSNGRAMNRRVDIVVNTSNKI